MGKEENILIKWRNAFMESNLSSTTKHILHALGARMNMQGQNCYPNIKTIARYTGYSERTVCTHIDIAVEKNWLKKEIAGVAGQGWRKHKYSAVLNPKALKEVQHLQEDNEIDTEGTESLSKGTESNDKKALKEVQSNSLKNSSSNSKTEFSKDDKNEIELDRFKWSNKFDEFMEQYPNHSKFFAARNQWTEFLKPRTESHLKDIMSGLERALDSELWNKDNCENIPDIFSWIKNKMWLDY